MNINLTSRIRIAALLAGIAITASACASSGDDTASSDDPTATAVPATTESPAPATTEPPTSTEPPATTEPPTSTEPPATTEPPASTEPPAIAEPPVFDGVLAPSDTTHFGATWFSPPPPEIRDTVFGLWEEVSDASTVGRALVDWIDVEPARGDYRFDELDEQLDGIVAAGQQPMVTIASVDTSGTEFPEWLGGFEPESAADAYIAMVAELLPVLERHDVWTLAISNEPPLAGDDDLDRADFATFVELVVDGLQEIAPELPVTFTFAGGDPFIDDPAIDRLIEAVDVYSVNHYCLREGLLAEPLEEATANIDRHVARAGDLPIVFQEFGCPAGVSMGSSEDYQLAWFELAFDHVMQNEQVRAAFVFEFLDWSQETYDLDYGAAEDVLIAELGAEFAERLRDWVLTSGLVRIDGTTRPVFDFFVDVAASS